MPSSVGGMSLVRPASAGLDCLAGGRAGSMFAHSHKLNSCVSGRWTESNYIASKDEGIDRKMERE